MPPTVFFVVWLARNGLLAARGFLTPGADGALLIAVIGLPYVLGGVVLAWLQYQLYRGKRWAVPPSIILGVIGYWILLSVITAKD